VTLGGSAPVKTENAGAVDSESLAADSIRSGGGFSANRGAAPGDTPAVDPRAGEPHTRGGPHPEGLETQDSYGGKAPGYVMSQYLEDKKGPHGKNLNEGGFQGSGMDGKPLPEPMSEQDPSRLALHGMVSGVGGTQPTETRPKMKGETMAEDQPYGVLGSDEPA